MKKNVQIIVAMDLMIHIIISKIQIFDIYKKIQKLERSPNITIN